MPCRHGLDDQPQFDDDRYYIYIRTRQGSYVWAFDDIQPSSGLLFHKFNDSILCATAYARKDIEHRLEIARMAYIGCDAIAIKADTQQLLPDHLRRMIKWK